MTTYPHGRSTVAPPKREWLTRLLVQEMWAALGIVVMWLAVLFDAILGPGLVFANVAGDSVTIPSAVVLGLFAFLATWVVARYGFGPQRTDVD